MKAAYVKTLFTMDFFQQEQIIMAQLPNKYMTIKAKMEKSIMSNLPNQLIMDIIKMADGGLCTHKKCFANVMEELTKPDFPKFEFHDTYFELGVVSLSNPTGEDHNHLWVSGRGYGVDLHEEYEIYSQMPMCPYDNIAEMVQSSNNYPDSIFNIFDVA